METTQTKPKIAVSQETKEAARRYAMRNSRCNAGRFFKLYYAYIEGAVSNTPIEHKLEPNK
jgi:hypothetical protein